MSEWLSCDFFKKRQPFSEAGEFLLNISNTLQPLCAKISGKGKSNSQYTW